MFHNGDRSGFGRFDFGGGSNNENNSMRGSSRGGSSRRSRRRNNNNVGYYEGNWKKGKYNGLGRLVVNDTVYEGVFENGIFMESNDDNSNDLNATEEQKQEKTNNTYLSGKYEEPEDNYHGFDDMRMVGS